MIAGSAKAFVCQNNANLRAFLSPECVRFLGKVPDPLCLMGSSGSRVEIGLIEMGLHLVVNECTKQLPCCGLGNDFMSWKRSQGYICTPL
jgi:hypothetical protein